MGFVAVSVNDICEQVELSATVEKRDYTLDAYIRDDIQCNYRIRDECMQVSSVISGENITFNFGFIYTLEELKYLDVSPENVVWISPDEAIVYFVSSNTEWKVE